MRVELVADKWPDKVIVRRNLPDKGWQVPWSLTTRRPVVEGWDFFENPSPMGIQEYT